MAMSSPENNLSGKPRARIPSKTSPDDVDASDSSNIELNLQRALRGPTMIFDGECNLCNEAMYWYTDRLH